LIGRPHALCDAIDAEMFSLCADRQRATFGAPSGG
jgi:hypothetical protein